MSKERTLIIIKPDAFSKKITGKIIAVLEDNDLKMVAAKMVRLSPEQAGGFYKEHKGKHFYEPLIDFMCSNPILVMVVEGEDVVSRSRELMGATDPSEAAPGTIRKKWAQDGRHNIIHGSDSLNSASREIGFFFPDTGEIISWEEKEYRM